VTATATIWRTCPVCGRSFEQPDDPGRKRVYCSRACQQAAYRARQRSGSGQRQSNGRQRTGRQEWRSDHRQQRQQRADPGGNGAGQRQRGGQRRQEQRQPPPTGANGSGRWRTWCAACGGQRAEHTVHHDQAAHERARRRCEALLRKADGTPFEPEAAACRAKADALRAKYGL
jgi:Protein of unknown function (DUF2786)